MVEFCKFNLSIRGQMNTQLVNEPEILFIGVSVRTNNKNEMDPSVRKIAGLVDQYWQQDLSEKIPNRKNPGRTICVYTDYQSDEHGDYTYVMGEEVTSLENVPPNFTALQIPAAKFKRFTTLPGKMPFVVIEAWQKIWTMSPDQLGGQRAYQNDFEIYDQRTADPDNAVMDIYIGIK